MDGKSISEVVHELASGMHAAGTISDERMREFDVMCKRPPSRYTPAQIKRIREKTASDQGVFAACLNVSTDTVRRWERGQTQPQGASLQLLNILDQKGLDPLA